MHAGRRLILSALLAGAAHAAPTLDPLLSDHAVLQRDRPVAVSGSAAPRERLTITLGNDTRTAVADKAGRFSAPFPAHSPGPALTLTVQGARGATASASDLRIGDVWLCSGQSNMEFPVSRALNHDAEVAGSADPDMRLFKVPQNAAPLPQTVLGKPTAWKAATPDSVAPFSAACFFMARELRKTQKVPVGLIDSTWGGTAIRPWMDPASAAALSPEDAALLVQFGHNPAAAYARFGERWAAWWSARQPTRPWAQPNALQWKPMKASYWETWGDPALADFNGVVWARSRVTLTAAEAQQAATLSLGVIDEIDTVWVNGVSIGSSFGFDSKRSYKLPKGVLHAGENSIVVNIVDSYGFGGFRGPDDELAIHLADGSAKPLAPTLEYSIAPKGIGDPPRPPWDAAAGVSLIYNGMIAPLGHTALRGAAWYQGESDGGMATGYDQRLSGLIHGWRRQFGDPAMPFIVVSLANWGPPPTAPVASGWAMVRDAQRRVATGDPHGALAQAIDIGDRLELHPANKQELGLRLAHAATVLAYGGAGPASGPQPQSARTSGSNVVVSFTGVKGQLHGWSGAPIGFELCGATQASCRFATARTDGTSVVLTGDGQPATRVRYAWADAPVVNLYDEAPLPVGSFELPVAP